MLSVFVISYRFARNASKLAPLWERNNLVMDAPAQNCFSGPVTVFQERRLPVPADASGIRCAGQEHTICEVPLPRNLSAIGERHRFIKQDGWRIYSPRYTPDASLEGHLTFALKHEGLDLAVLKRLFVTTGPAPLADLVKAQPTGAYARRIWFLYEWLTGAQLDLPNASRGSYPLVVDPNQQLAVPAETSPRHRVKNNLPGTPAFCPLCVPHRSAGGLHRHRPEGARAAGHRCRAA